MRDKVLLAQTDTTVGFLSQNSAKLNLIKKRAPDKPFVRVFSSFSALKHANIRVPSSQKKRVRQSKKTTFISKNRAFRVVQNTPHTLLLKRFDFLYSTSANESGKSYDNAFCYKSSDIIVEDFRGLQEMPPSDIIKLGKKKIRRVR
jgi:tRNA A37 threonylcarbamoyladenosine synthetase subunit TsaC/SUA5/YrdC